MSGYSWRGSYWHPCACASGYCKGYTKARHTWLCWYCEHDRCAEVHRLPTVWEHEDWDSPEFRDIGWHDGTFRENPENQPGQLSCYECGLAVPGTHACRVCGRGACTDHCPEEGREGGAPMCLQCFYEVPDSESPLKPVFCPCQVCGPSKEEKCIFNTWSRIPSLWTTGRLCFDCNVSHANSSSRCVCTCGDERTQRRERALKRVDEAIASSSYPEA